MNCHCMNKEMKATIEKMDKACSAWAVIPSYTVATMENLKGLRNAFIHVSDINTTFYVNNKLERVIIWKGPLFIDNYDYENNPLGIYGQTVYDFANKIMITFSQTGEHTVVSIGDNEAWRDAVDEIRQDLDAEIAARQDAIAEVNRQLEQEAKAREDLADVLGTEIDDLDNKIDTSIEDVENHIDAVEADIQEQIDAIESKSDVVDIVDTYADLEKYDTASLGDNDVVKVLQDETHNDAISYYRWDKTAGTWNYIGSIGPYYTKAETDEKITEAVGGVDIPTRAKNLPRMVVGNSSSNPTRTAYWEYKSNNVVPTFTFYDLDGAGVWGGWPQTPIDAATPTTAGVMSAQDKANLDALVEGGGGVSLAEEYGDSSTTALSQKFLSEKLNGSAVVIGSNNTSAGKSSIVIGHDSQARAANNQQVVVGGYADAGVAGNNIAIGYSAKADGPSSMAIGSEASAPQSGTLAIGHGAKATQLNSTAIGSGAQTSRMYEVSFGTPGIPNPSRYLANVTDGELPQDAVTVNQLNQKPTITMVSEDPGEGVELAENNFIAVYEA